MHLKMKFTMACLMGCVYMGILGCGNNTNPQKNSNLSDQVEVKWTWKRTVNQASNVVYGTIKNKTDQYINQVDLEFQTRNSEGDPIYTHTFSVQNFKPKEEKPFTQDYPAQSAREDSGFVTVKKVTLSN